MPARRDSLAPMLAWLYAAVGGAACPAATGERLRLVVEELFANTLEHGFAGESDLPVTLVFGADDGGIHLRYTDQAPAFDLTSTTPLAPDGERLGGFGLNLVRALSSELRYHRENGCNHLDIDFSTSPAP